MNGEILIPNIKDEITDVFDALARKYGTRETRKLVDLNDYVVKYDIDLGGRMCGILYIPGVLICGGLRNGILREIHNYEFKRNIKKHWRKVVNDIENDILIWREEHKGLLKERSN